MCALTAASRDIIRDTKAAIAPRKNEGATAFEKICVSLSMSGTNSMLQLLHPLAWCEFAISVSFLPREHRLMSAPRRSDAQCAFQRLPTRFRAAMTHVRRDGTSVSCHKQSSHNATFGDTARLADDSGFSDRSRDSRTRDAALRHANRLAIDDGIGRSGTHRDSDKQCEPSARQTDDSKHDHSSTAGRILS